MTEHYGELWKNDTYCKYTLQNISFECELYVMFIKEISHTSPPSPNTNVTLYIFLAYSDVQNFNEVGLDCMYC